MQRRLAGTTGNVRPVDWGHPLLHRATCSASSWKVLMVQHLCS
jgi:hypothetical protein